MLLGHLTILGRPPFNNWLTGNKVKPSSRVINARNIYNLTMEHSHHHHATKGLSIILHRYATPRQSDDTVRATETKTGL